MQEEAARVQAEAKTALETEQAKVAELEAQLMEAANEDKELGDQNKELSERVMMLEAENTRLKQMAKENDIAKAASKHVLSPSRGALSPGTPDSFVSTPGKGNDDELERQQAELDAKRVSLANARTQADHEVLLATIEKGGEIGFSGGQPILACVTFRSLLHWRVFELERTGLFDRIMGQMSVAVENNTDNNAQLTYWLSNTFTLLHLLQRTLKTSSGGAGGRAKRSGGGSIFERFNSRLLASRTPTKKEGEAETPGIPGVPLPGAVPGLAVGAVPAAAPPVADVRCGGSRRRVTSVITPRVPSLPTNSLVSDSPAASFNRGPPRRTAVPSASTTCRPST